MLWEPQILDSTCTKHEYLCGSLDINCQALHLYRQHGGKPHILNLNNTLRWMGNLKNVPTTLPRQHELPVPTW